MRFGYGLTQLWLAPFRLVRENYTSPALATQSSHEAQTLCAIEKINPYFMKKTKITFYIISILACVPFGLLFLFSGFRINDLFLSPAAELTLFLLIPPISIIISFFLQDDKYKKIYKIFTVINLLIILFALI